MKLRAAVLAGIVIALIVAACGGGDDGGGDLTLEEYLGEVEVLLDDVAAQANSEDLFGEGSDLPGDSEEEQIEIMTAFFSVLGDAVGDFANALSDLDPPKEAEAAHREFLAESEAFADNAGQFVAQVEDAESEADIEAAFAFLDDADDPEDACMELQALADANAIDVALNCSLE